MPPKPNEDQIAYWNGPVGQRWADDQASIDPGIRQYGEAAMLSAQPLEGERVLDVGCGSGDTTLALARLVGPEGRIVGVDISAPMLARARTRATPADWVSFVEADASSCELAESEFDLIFSRFGVMFFDDPTAAFANLRKALRPSGRLAFVCWRTLAENAWARVPLEAAMAATGANDPWPADGPGPFAFGPSRKVDSILRAAGFVDVTVDARDFEHRWGNAEPPTLEDAVEGATTYGPAARLVNATDDAGRAQIRDAVSAVLAPYLRADGVFLGAAVYVVTARTAP